MKAEFVGADYHRNNFYVVKTGGNFTLCIVAVREDSEGNFALMPAVIAAMP